MPSTFPSIYPSIDSSICQSIHPGTYNSISISLHSAFLLQGFHKKHLYVPAFIFLCIVIFISISIYISIPCDQPRTINKLHESRDRYRNIIPHPRDPRPSINPEPSPLSGNHVHSAITPHLLPTINSHFHPHPHLLTIHPVPVSLAQASFTQQAKQS